MSHEQPSPASNETQIPTSLRNAELVREFSELPGFQVKDLGLQRDFLLPPEHFMGPGAEIQIGREHSFQHLEAIIAAKHELFGVVRAAIISLDDPTKYQTAYAVTRFDKAAGYASMVGFLEPGKPMTLGRSHQEDLDEATSRNHVELRMYENGYIQIKDLNSLNGTKIITTEDGRGRPTETVPGLEPSGINAINYAFKSLGHIWRLQSSDMYEAMKAHL